MTLERLVLVFSLAVTFACTTAHATPDAQAPPSPIAAVETVESVAPDPAPRPTPAAPTNSAAAAKPFGFGVSGGPLTINSEELEADDANGRRKIVFRKNVVVVQGDLKVTCQKLEALYPAGSSQPTRLVASTNVQVTQGDQRVWCDQAIYDRSAEKLLCRGNGRFLDGESELRGREIDIDLKRETVSVRGGARVVIQDDAPASPASEPQP